jgi:radical SAM protein with 4Fe4S-binding SPASM domain
MPCYIGHEYSLVLGDGNVMFCCQCSRPLGNLHQDRFEQIWKSEAYREARRLARKLPTAKQSLPECECFTACSHVAVNVEVYGKLHGEPARRTIA